ncbi:MAG: hypothetical protein KY475_10465 [Planctomycetes bacterium]|nr:hypothetical protein [Planctomycetota bacterium]
MRGLVTVVALLATACGSGYLLQSAVQAADEEKPEHTIKQVMAKAHKSKLINKVAAGEATEEEAKELLALYKALGGNKPPKGELEGWKKKTATMIEAAQAVVDGEEGAGEKLSKAANCANCDKEHKPS